MATLNPTRDLLFDEAPDLEDEELQSVLERQSTGLQATLDRLREELQAVRDDPALTDEGKKERAREIVEDLRSAATKAGMVEHLDQLRGEIETERERLFNVEHRLEIEGEDEHRALAAEREVRDHLRGLDPLEAQQVLRKAAREDRRLVLRAVEMDPLADVEPIASEETLREVREVHVQSRYPERAGAMANRERVVDLMSTNLERANEVAREVAGAPLMESDAGTTVLHE